MIAMTTSNSINVKAAFRFMAGFSSDSFYGHVRRLLVVLG